MNLGKLVVRIGADMSSLHKAFRETETRTTRMGRSIQSVGKTATTYLTAAILALGAVSVNAWDKQAKAVAAVENGIASTGGTARRTLSELTAEASRLQQTSLFGDEEILQGVTSQLLTFTNIAGEQFDRTQVAALNLATKLGGDLKGASIQLGKALNDPVANLSALSRSGIQFSKDQKAVIKALAESGRLAEAQTIILDELEKQYGGTAEAAARAGTGPIKQFSNNLGDLLEMFGQIVLVVLNPLFSGLNDLVLKLQALPAPFKVAIVVVAGLVAGIGPLLLGVGSLLVVLPKLRAALLALNRSTIILTAKVLLITAAVAAFAAAAYLVYKNWSGIRAFFVRLWDGVVSATSAAMGLVQAKVEGAFLSLVRTLSGLGAKLLEPARRIAEALGADDVRKRIETVQATIAGVVSDAAVRAAEGRAARLGGALRASVSGIGETFRDAGASVAAEVTALYERATSAVASAAASLDDVADGASGAGAAIAEAAGAAKATDLDGVAERLATALRTIDRLAGAGQLTPLQAGLERLRAYTAAMESAAEVAGGWGSEAFRRYVDQVRAAREALTGDARDRLSGRALAEVKPVDIFGRRRDRVDVLGGLDDVDVPTFDERRLELVRGYQVAFDAVRSTVDGVSAAIGTAVGELLRWRSPITSLKEAGLSLGRSLSDVFRGVVADIAAAIAKALVLKGLMTVFKAGTGGVGGFIGSALSAVAGGANLQAAGPSPLATALARQPAPQLTITMNRTAGPGQRVQGGWFFPDEMALASVRGALTTEVRTGLGDGSL